MLRELCTQLPRQRGHCVEVEDAAHIEPVPNLLYTHATLPLGHAGFAESLGECITRKPDQRGLRRRDVTLQRPLLNESGRGNILRLGGGMRGGHGQSK